MDLLYLIKGIIIGFVASIPLGPVGVMCIQRTLCTSRNSGFITGLGAASGDSIYAAVALFSLSFVLRFAESNMPLVKVVGGITIIIVGMYIFLRNPVVQIRRNRAGKGSNLWSDYISAFLVTLANVAFILILIALFAALGVSGGDYSSGLMSVLGVFCGAAAWWFLLTFMVSLLRHKIRPRHLLWINRISGALIVVLGIFAILSIFVHYSIIDVLPNP